MTDGNHMEKLAKTKKYTEHRKRIPSVLGPHKIATSQQMFQTHEIVFDLGMQIIDTKKHIASQYGCNYLALWHFRHLPDTKLKF